MPRGGENSRSRVPVRRNMVVSSKEIDLWKSFWFEQQAWGKTWRPRAQASSLLCASWWGNMSHQDSGISRVSIPACTYYPFFAHITPFCAYYPLFAHIIPFLNILPCFFHILSPFCTYYPFLNILSLFCTYYPFFSRSILLFTFCPRIRFTCILCRINHWTSPEQILTDGEPKPAEMGVQHHHLQWLAS